MPHSLRAKIKGLRYKGIITDKDCDRLCKALDNENVLDKIIGEIDQIKINGNIRDVECFRAGINTVLNIINKYKAESEVDNDKT